MSKSLFTAIVCALFLSAGLAFTACKKGEGLNGGGGTYILRGRILKECSGTPWAGINLRVSFSSGSLLNSEYDASAGSSTTSADGTFQIECKNHGSGIISLHSDAGNSGVNWVDNFEIGSIRDTVIDFGTIYDMITHTWVVRVDVTNPLAMTDTLYYGPPWDIRVLHPVSGSEAASFSHTSPSSGFWPPPETKNVDIVWGIGRKDLDSAINFYVQNGGSQTPYHRIQVAAKHCGISDTAVLVVQ